MPRMMTMRRRLVAEDAPVVRGEAAVREAGAVLRPRRQRPLRAGRTESQSSGPCRGKGLEAGAPA